MQMDNYTELLIKAMAIHYVLGLVSGYAIAIIVKRNERK